MKAIITARKVRENWSGHKHKLQHLFIWLTGYEIMFEGSRKDLVYRKAKHI